MSKHLKIINFQDFPVDDRCVQIPGKLFMVDNIDDERPRRIRPRVAEMPAPVQLSMTVIFMCLSGEIRLILNQQEEVVTSNDCLTMNTGAFFQIENLSDDFRGIMIAINPDFIKVSDNVQLGVAIYQHIATRPIYHMDEPTVRETLELYRMMKRKLQDPDFLFKPQVAQLYIDLFKYNGFHSFSKRENTDEPVQRHTRRDEIFSHFLHKVQHHYREQRQIIWYASQLCVSPKYLSSVVHEVSDKYASEWIDEYVIMEAKAMLRNSNSSIKEICAELHFSSQSLFTKYFRQHTGFTPKEFRKQI